MLIPQVIDAITRHLELGSYLSWSEEQKTTWLLNELGGKRPLFPPGIDLSPDEAEVVATFRWGLLWSPFASVQIVASVWRRL